MSGGIKYRLTTQERKVLAEQLGVLEGLRARLGSSGIDAKLGDSQMEVSVEETPEGPRFEIEYPFDNDLISENGRIYVKDVFKLSKEADKILSFDRSLRQELHTNKKFRFWVDLASKDHPDAKITSHPEHLRRLLEDLSKIPKPSLNGQPLQRFLQGALQHLHRPFPNGNEGLVRKNFEVFKNVLDKALPFGMRMKFNDPQSGLKLRQEGSRLLLELQVVFDTDSTPGREAEKNGRIYLLDSYEIDASSGKVLSAKREIVPSEVSTPAFDQTYAALKDSAGALPITEELQDLANGWVKGLIPSQIFAKPGPITTTPPIIAELPKDPAGKLLYNLYLFTSQDEKAGKKFFEAMVQRPSISAMPSKLSLSEIDRGALRDVLALAIGGDASGLEKTKSAWLSENQLQPATQILLEALSQYANGDYQDSIRTLAPQSELSPFALQVMKAAKIRLGKSRHEQAAEILKIAVAERLEHASRHDRAWLRAISDGISGNSQADPELRRLAILSFFKKFEAKLQSEAGNLSSIAADTPSTDAYEREVSFYLVRDPAIRELMAWLDESDADLRNRGLLGFGRSLLTGNDKLPATAKKIAESLDSSIPGVSELNAWFSGQANFGQKIEILLPAFVEEAISPHTILSMTAAGALGRVAKATFFSRVGFQTRRLRWAAEAVSIGAEAPAFVLSDKLLLSAFDSPEGQWDKVPRDTLGALVAFGTLRGAGIASKRFEKFLSGSKGFETWSAGRSRIALAERWLPRAEKLAESEGKVQWLRHKGGKQVVAALNYLGKTGLPREWTRKTLPFLSIHGLGIGGLMAANSLTRLIGLREPSKQGWTSDLVDDSLMYGHFLIAGHLAGRLGTRNLDARLAYLESQPLEVKAPSSKLTEKASQQKEGVQKPAEESESTTAASEKLPAVDLPPEVKELGKTIAKWWRKGMPELRRAGTEWFQTTLARIRKGKTSDPALSDPKPEISEAETASPLKESNSPEAQDKDPAASSPSVPDTTPTLVPEKPPGAPVAFLAPVPEAVQFRRVGTRPTVSVKGKEFKVDVEILGRAEEIRFKEKESSQEATFEAVIGREDIQSPAEAVGIDFGFPSTETHIASNHAKIRIKVIFDTKVEEKVEASESWTETKPVKRKVGRVIPKEWQVSLEDLGSTGGTFLNGKRVKGSVRLKDQDQIRLGKDGPDLKLRLDPSEWKAFLIRPNLPLREGKDSWTLGREHAGADLPDLRFPISERDVSRRHARIVRDAEGNFFVQDLSWNGTRVNMRRIHGSRPLRDGDLLQLGNGTEMTFTLPSDAPARDSVPPQAYPQHPNLSTLPPEQASVHPAYRFVSPSSLEAYILQLATKGENPSAVRAGQVRLPDGRDVLLSSLNTAWAIGHEGEAAPNTQNLEFSTPDSVAKNPALLYIDNAGRFILRSLHPEGKISVQTRGERFLPPSGEAKKPSTFKNQVSGWTVLEGGERVFLGDDFYFDFWPGSPVPPPERPSTYTEEITPLAPETQVVEATSPQTIAKSEFYKDGKLILSPDKAFRLRSQAELTEIQINPNTPGGEIEIWVPTSMGKIQETRFFQENGAWKIRSEGGEGNPLIVNGMRLPAKMTLDLLNDTTLQIGETKIQVHMP